jgi:ribonucleoside-diphosphate reductase alpha chain
VTVLSEQIRIDIRRFFTIEGVDPFDTVDWVRRLARISGASSEVIFEQDGVEFPESWSQNAVNIVSQKYFRGRLASPERESSLRGLIGRVVGEISRWGSEDGYFADAAEARTFTDELTYLLLHQKASFNSPVWFNIGVPGALPQSSACFILAVDDSMESILNWYTEEGMIFKRGSGSGVNLSRIRSATEHLSGGGRPSGPVSFMRGADASAGAIRSGGTTRRAAKMVVLDADHPDIAEFIWCKAREERKAQALSEAGFDLSFDGADSTSLLYQNANNSVRLTDEFMEAALAGGRWSLTARTTGEVVATVDAADLLRQIAEAAWQCADPGVQFDTTINRWHTTPAAGRITASNPCSEYLHLDNSACNLASINLLAFLDAGGRFDVAGFRAAVRVVFCAQEILVGRSHYPTEAIGANAVAYRQLGLGYANLGALLMTMGLPYDSDAGRATAAAVTAIMCGEAYRTSAHIAARMGPFEQYAANRPDVLRVLDMHRDAVSDIDAGRVPTALVAAAQAVWDDACELASTVGVRNAQSTVLAPTGCLVGGSLIPTERGLVRLRSLGDPHGAQWQDLGTSVGTDEGPRTATQFYVNGAERVVTIDTGRGYRIAGTPTHRIKVVDAHTGDWVWRRFGDIEAGDLVPLQLNQLVGDPRDVILPPLGEMHWTGDWTTRAPRAMSPELAEFIGYFMGDGSLHAKGLRLCVAAEDIDVAERLRVLGKDLFNLEVHLTDKAGYVELAFHSVPLTLWWEACGFAKTSPVDGHVGKGWHPHVPDAILAANCPETYRAFIRGLFEADGTVGDGYPHWCTTSFDFSRDVQSLLLAIGYPTTRKMDRTGWGGSPLAVLRLLNLSYSANFATEIGFMGGRKQAALVSVTTAGATRRDHIPVPRSLVDRLIPENGNLRRTMLQSLARNGMVSRRSASVLLQRTGDQELARLLGFFYDRVHSASLDEDQWTYDLSVPDNVTYVANGFVSHNTISFMMDCDTTGIEPDLALRKSKSLVGGGSLTIVNRSLAPALARLGYGPTEISGIEAHVEANGSILGAPGLAREHYPVFACSIGDNAVSAEGHVQMMAAVQPFLSGGISKTVNLGADATAAEVQDLLVSAWHSGVKAIAVYRDNSKWQQPLAATGGDSEPAGAGADDVAATVPEPVRRRLPRHRASRTMEFRVADCKGFVTVGEYEDGRPGEIFVRVSKQGSTLAGIMDAFAVAVSHGLQYGVPLRAYVDAYCGMRFEPAGVTDDPDIRIATSLMDYLFRRLALTYLSPEERAEMSIFATSERLEPTLPGVAEAAAGAAQGIDVAPDPPSVLSRSGSGASSQAAYDTSEGGSADSASPLCMTCGTRMVRAGSCYACATCGATSGCS